jgi:uncharacterized protein YigA (DUF484 family)
MTRKTETAAPAPLTPPTEAQVEAYLEAHPDFLVRHPDLALKLVPPSRFSGGPMVDLQQYMIGRLRDELDEMRGCAQHLITTSRSNMSTQARTHEAALAALTAGSLETLGRVVAEDFPTLLDVDIAVIGFQTGEQEPRTLPGLPTLPNGLVDDILGASDVLLRAEADGDPAIFGDGAGVVRSFALVRLAPKPGQPGLLSLGSRNERAFHSCQGTELLAFLARVIEDCVTRWAPPA